MSLTLHRGEIAKQYGRFQLRNIYRTDTTRSQQPELTNRYDIVLEGEDGSLIDISTVSKISVNTSDRTELLSYLQTWVRGQQIVIGMIKQQLRETDDEAAVRGLQRRLEALQPRAEEVLRALRELNRDIKGKA